MSESQVSKVLDHIDRMITRDRSAWSKWPGGWPDEIGTALVDAVYSARAVYETSNGGGVLSRVRHWRGASEATRSLEKLLAEIGDSPEVWADKTFKNRQHAPGRMRRRPDDPTKAGAIREAAQNLRGLGVDTSDDIDAAGVDEVKSALRRVPGVGYATVNYFLMLLGKPGVKPDVMVHGFLRDALGSDGGTLTNRDAVELVTSAAEALGVQPHELDHAIWANQRANSKRE